MSTALTLTGFPRLLDRSSTAPIRSVAYGSRHGSDPVTPGQVVRPAGGPMSFAPAPDPSSFQPVIELADVMRAYPKRWFVSGGWAIDLFVGRVTRLHDDIEVGTFFPDQPELEEHLVGWELSRIRNGSWEPLVPGEAVTLPDFQL